MAVRFWISLLLFFLMVGMRPLHGQDVPALLSLTERERSLWVDSMLALRLDSLLPSLMEREGIDMWLMTSREYNEDPVLKTMLPSEWLSARRRTILVFYYPGKGGSLQKIAIARYNVGRLLKGEWNIDVYPDQWQALTELVKRLNPKKIGVNVSEHTGLADGLVSTERSLLEDALPPEFRQRIVSAEKLAIGWLETRSLMELKLYGPVCALSRQIIFDGFSESWIKPGVTTTDDIVWRLRQLVRENGLTTWFHPSVSVQRADHTRFDHLRSFSGRPRDEVIRYGDLLHVDFGIVYNRLHTDQQQHFYVYRQGEDTIPFGLAEAFRKAGRVQDLLTARFQTGSSGNGMLLSALQDARAEGIEASVYSHPIGFHGHAAGPTIGLWDQQGGVAGAGDYKVYANTAYSIELNAASEVPEWGKVIRIMLEEDGYFDGRLFHYFDGRQEKIYGLRLVE